MARRFLLDPNETAMENLWRASRVAVLYILSHMKVQNKFEERDEIIDNCILRGVNYFLRDKIRGHTYNRDFSFFENVYGSCWSAVGNELGTYITKKKKLMMLNSISEGIAGSDFTIEDSLIDTGVHPLDGNWSKNTRNSILSSNERARFGLPSHARYPISTLKAIWQLQDEDNELAGIPTSEDEYERREAILAKYFPLAEDPPKSNEKRYRDEAAHEHYMRYRERKLAYAKKYREEHREEIREYQREYNKRKRMEKDKATN